MTWIGSGVAKHGDWFVVNFAAEWVLPYIFAGPPTLHSRDPFRVPLRLPLTAPNTPKARPSFRSLGYFFLGSRKPLLAESHLQGHPGRGLHPDATGSRLGLRGCDTGVGRPPIPALRAFLWIISGLLSFDRAGTDGSDAHLHHRAPALHRRFCHQLDPHPLDYLLLLDDQRGFRLCGLAANALAFETLLPGLCSSDCLWADLHGPGSFEHAIPVVIPTGFPLGFCWTWQDRQVCYQNCYRFWSGNFSFSWFLMTDSAIEKMKILGCCPCGKTTC